MSSKDCISWSVFPWTNIKLDIIRCKWCHLYDMYCLSVCLRQLTLFSGTNTCGMSSTKAWLDFQGTETFLTLASRDSLMYCTRIVFFYVNTILRVIFLDRVSFFLNFLVVATDSFWTQQPVGEVFKYSWILRFSKPLLLLFNFVSWAMMYRLHKIKLSN